MTATRSFDVGVGVRWRANELTSSRGLFLMFCTTIHAIVEAIVWLNRRNSIANLLSLKRRANLTDPKFLHQSDSSESNSS